MVKIDEAIEHIKGTMAIEGIVLTDEDIARGRAVLKGTFDIDAAVAEIRAKYVTASAAQQRKVAGAS